MTKSNETDDFKLRALLAITYSGATLYADDGELSCCAMHPFIDFKRDTPEEIALKMQERSIKRWKDSLNNK